MLSFAYITTQLQETIVAIRQHAVESFTIVGILWGIHLFNVLLGGRLALLGILPRSISGLKGIIFSPFIHGNFNHLFFNSIPLFLLADFMLIATGQHFIAVTLWIMLLSGLLTWLFARIGLHIGASSIIMAYWSFLLVLAIYQPTLFNIILAVIMLYYLGSLALNLFPSGKTVSFEGHIFGALSGILVALYWLFV